MSLRKFANQSVAIHHRTDEMQMQCATATGVAQNAAPYALDTIIFLCWKSNQRCRPYILNKYVYLASHMHSGIVKLLNKPLFN